MDVEDRTQPARGPSAPCPVCCGWKLIKITQFGCLSNKLASNQFSKPNLFRVQNKYEVMKEEFSSLPRKRPEEEEEQQ